MTVDLLELLRVIWKNIWLVLIAIAAGAVLAFLVTKLFITPKYQATSTIYILSKSTSITSLADLQIGSQLAGDFAIIATTREVLENVIEDEHLNESYDQLKREIKVSSPSNTHMLRITVTDTDPEMAARISNTLADELRDKIAEIMNTERPSTVEAAVVPAHPISPNVKKNTVLGAFALAVLVILFIVIRHLSDDTIKDDEDVRKYLELDTLAQFPLIKDKTSIHNIARKRK
ncbi:MAG: polysaccharide export protein [Lachnospiraceae bacterium]|nr:polysaccharide export protein [Lachnospiraceae bacterium]